MYIRFINNTSTAFKLASTTTVRCSLRQEAGSYLNPNSIQTIEIAPYKDYSKLQNDELVKIGFDYLDPINRHSAPSLYFQEYIINLLCIISSKFIGINVHTTMDRIYILYTEVIKVQNNLVINIRFTNNNSYTTDTFNINTQYNPVQTDNESRHTEL